MSMKSQYLFEARSDFVLKQKELCLLIYKTLLKQMPDEIPVLKDDKMKIDIVKDFLENLEEHTFISKYLVWVVKQYVNNLWQYPEDVEKLENNLNKFYRSLSLLKREGKDTDINKYSMKEFNEMILELKETNRQEDINIKNNEVDKIFEDSNWLLLSPKTQDAAIKYGKGTEWCTAATNGTNWFHRYNDKGPLYIIINKKDPDEKYQFHIPTGSFMDIYDSEVYIGEMDEIFDKNQGLKAAVSKIVKDYYSDKKAEDISIDISEEDLINFMEHIEEKNNYCFASFNPSDITGALTEHSIPDFVTDYDVEPEDVLSYIDYDIMTILSDDYHLFTDKEVKDKVITYLFDTYHYHNGINSITPLNNLKKLIFSCLSEFNVGEKYGEDKSNQLAEDFTQWAEANLKELLHCSQITDYYDSLTIVPNDISIVLNGSLTASIMLSDNDKAGYYYLQCLPTDIEAWEYYWDVGTSQDFDDWMKEKFYPYLKLNFNIHKHLMDSLHNWNPYEPYDGEPETIEYDPYEDNYHYYDEDNIEDKEENEKVNESFEGSKKIIAYHGSQHKKFNFDTNKVLYLTKSKEEAKSYAIREWDEGLIEGEIPVVFTFEVTYNKPFITDGSENAFWEFCDEMMVEEGRKQELIDKGYDSIIHDNLIGVFYPNQVKLIETEILPKSHEYYYTNEDGIDPSEVDEFYYDDEE